MRRNPPAEKPVVQQRSLVACPSDHKSLAIFDARGLLAWCKVCHSEQLISYEEIDRIRQSFQASPAVV